MKPSPALAILVSRFPKAFTVPTPLAIGIHDAILASGALDAKQLRRALSAWCRGRRYQALAKGGDRIDLDGSPAGAVTDEQVTAARHEIGLRKARRAAKEAAAAARETAAKAKAVAPPKPVRAPHWRP